MGGLLTLAYGAVSYVIFFVTFLYAIGFVGNLVVPNSIDSGGMVSSTGVALAINLALLGIFAVQHSVMARPAFKKRWTRIVPPSMERSTSVLLTSGALILMFWLWRPMPGVVWSVETPAVRWVIGGLFWVGWAVVLLSTFMINHFDLFGLRQVWLRFRGEEYTEVNFMARWFYRYVRHPIMLGFIIAFWATPDMSLGHLLFAVMTTVYILVALKFFEEKDLLAAHGASYEAYRRSTSMLVPSFRARGDT